MRNQTRRILTVVAAVVGAVGLTAAPAEAIKFRVLALPGATANGYTPPNVIKKVGAQLAFTNLDAAAHDVRSTQAGLFSSPLAFNGQTVQVNGAASVPKGKYGFFCTIHPQMRGTLTVK